MNIQDIVLIAEEAGKAILGIYARDFEVEFKADDSPLTIADKTANEIIVNRLQQTFPAIPFISEEERQLSYAERKKWDKCWLIDPLDGTKEFVKKNGEFTVNIALIKNGEPVLGVVHVPVQNKTYFALQGEGAFLKSDGKIEKIHTRELINGKITIVGSRSHSNDQTIQFVEQKKQEFEEVEFVSAGSSLKICLVAEGKADVYPRFGPTMEWDTAAGHAVVKEAGGELLQYPEMTELQYNKENLLNPFFIVHSKKAGLN